MIILEERYGKVDWNKLIEKFGKFDKWHCHFSGIVYGNKGERHHTCSSEENWKKLILDM